MLKKELCIKCWNKKHRVHGYIYGWTVNDERHWKEGWLICPREYIKKGESSQRKTTDKPPIKCPYLLEYLLNNQED